jgi:hypothetical protein
VRFRSAAQPGSWRLEFAPLPAWTAPRVGQDQRGRLTWALLDLGFAFRAADLGFDLPELSVSTDVDVTASKLDATIPPVMLNSHLVNLRAAIDGSGLGGL